MSQPQVEPYKPFPTFSEFAAAAFDSQSYETFAGQLSQAKQSATPEVLDEMLRRATRAAAVDTGAIEGLYEVDRGFTMSVAAGAAAWDNIHLVKGEEVARAMNDALHGYDYVLDLVTESKPISQAWIRELHTVLCASQDTYRVWTSQGWQDQGFPKGQYKTVPNNPLNLPSATVHSYAPVEDTAPEMQRLVEELSGSEFREAHPVLQAAYAHYAFVCVHPFADGNGRVARALASVFLYRSPGVPLVVFVDQKSMYLDALELADAGDYRGFIQFVGERAIDAVLMVTTDLRTAAIATSGSSRLEELQAALTGRGGNSHEAVDALADRLLDQFLVAVDEAIAHRGDSPVRLVGLREASVMGSTPDSDFRAGARARSFRLVASVAAPAGAEVRFAYEVLIAKAGFGAYDFALVRRSALGPTKNFGAETSLGQFFVRDVDPSISASTTYRMTSLAESQVREIVEVAADLAQQTLKAGGYA